MKTVKELRELIKDLPDDALIMIRFMYDDGDWEYCNNIDAEILPMSQNPKNREYTIDNNGKDYLVIF